MQLFFLYHTILFFVSISSSVPLNLLISSESNKRMKTKWKLILFVQFSIFHSHFSWLWVDTWTDHPSSVDPWFKFSSICSSLIHRQSERYVFSPTPVLLPSSGSRCSLQTSFKLVCICFRLVVCQYYDPAFNPVVVELHYQWKFKYQRGGRGKKMKIGFKVNEVE